MLKCAFVPYELYNFCVRDYLTQHRAPAIYLFVVFISR